ncbi:MAG: dihydrolipoyl dehydrogenase [Bacteroidales bacterium]|nr:dihydrolipoyl dehydrogenase [Bacteroidales bacterium]MBN2758250.1 dihydrolipoyl dehydrogenase [Bacteroidales bacterium]
MKYDIIIIGSGPAGYVAAIRAGQVGLRTAIIEKENIGGMCLNWGCIPSKSMIESAKLYNKILKDAAKFGIDGIDKKAISFNYNTAVKRAKSIVKRLTKGVEGLLIKNGVEIIKGEAKITSKNTVSVENRSLEAENIIIATGSYSPEIKGDKSIIIDVNTLFEEREIPENILVVGSDSVAVELSQFFSLIGKNVTLATKGERLMPLADEYLADYLKGIFKKSKIEILYNYDIQDVNDKFKNNLIDINGKEIKADIIINARDRVGIIPKSDVKIEIENNFIITDENCKTSIDNIYAIGDVNGKSHFAHIASAEGLHVINKIKGINSKLDIKKYPLNMYSVPEIAQIGLTEKEIKEQKIEYKISEFPLSANGKAMTEGNSDGFVRILSEEKFGEVLGVQIVAPNATDMIAEASAFMQLESTVYDVAKTVHAHPTVSEIFMEAGFEGVDGAIHK